MVVSSFSDPRWPQNRARIVNAGRNAIVVWDFDGVVGDTEPFQAQSYEILLQRRAMQPSEGFFASLIGNNEVCIWEKLENSGFCLTSPVEDLVLERRDVFLTLVLDSLNPSWLATDLMPMFAARNASQKIVSNGDSNVISLLLAKWDLNEFVTQELFDFGTKSDFLFELFLNNTGVVLEDNAGFLAQAAAANWFTVGVNHSMSPASGVSGDVTVAI